MKVAHVHKFTPSPPFLNHLGMACTDFNTNVFTLQGCMRGVNSFRPWQHRADRRPCAKGVKMLTAYSSPSISKAGESKSPLAFGSRETNFGLIVDPQTKGLG